MYRAERSGFRVEGVPLAENALAVVPDPVETEHFAVVGQEPMFDLHQSQI